MDITDFSLLTDEQWLEIDHNLWLGERVIAWKKTMEYSGLGLKESVDLVFHRVSKLVIEQPENFKVDIKTYWNNTFDSPYFDD